MAPKMPERQFRINTQFAEEMADIKTQQLLGSQALGAIITVLDGIVDKLMASKLLSEHDSLVQDYFTAIGELKRVGLKMDPPVDPNAKVYQVKCPNCQAIINAEPEVPVERCDWCGHVFSDF
ncbi:MAG: hypothetical protein JRJ87_22245 [Deltaproteobacteria bacterium]|nr:hypothetical protein [Deltaproteobacteria bacterium]